MAFNVDDLYELMNEENNSVDLFNEAMFDRFQYDRIMNRSNDLNLSDKNFEKMEFNKTSNLFGKIGKVITAKKNAEEAAKVEEILNQRGLKYIGDCNDGKLMVYRSPNMLIKNKQCNILSKPKNYNIAYASIKWLAFLNCMLSVYDYAEDKIDHLLEKGIEFIYNDNKVTVKENYKYIAEKQLTVTDSYLYMVYTNSGWWVYFDLEVNGSKLKGLDDYMTKKSCLNIAYGYQPSTGKMYIFSEIINGSTKLREIKQN